MYLARFRHVSLKTRIIDLGDDFVDYRESSGSHVLQNFVWYAASANMNYHNLFALKSRVSAQLFKKTRFRGP